MSSVKHLHDKKGIWQVHTGNACTSFKHDISHFSRWHVSVLLQGIQLSDCPLGISYRCHISALHVHLHINFTSVNQLKVLSSHQLVRAYHG